MRAWLGAQASDRERLQSVTADLNSDAGWTEAVRGADYVLHVASPIPAINPRDEEELIAPARNGTLRVLRAARDAGVKRVGRHFLRRSRLLRPGASWRRKAARSR